VRPCIPTFQEMVRDKQIFEEIQNLIDMPRLKMIQPTRTRWLTLFESIQRILQQSKILYRIFAVAVIKDEHGSATEKRSLTA
jgi:hypothetical protein